MHNLFIIALTSSILYFTAELKENTTLNTKVWDAAGFHGNGTFPLHYFSYNNSVLLNMIFQHLHKTNFSGVTVSRGRKWTFMTVVANVDCRCKY